MECVVVGKKENRRGNGLEVPCKYIVKGPKYMLTNIECMIKDYLGEEIVRVYIVFILLYYYYILYIYYNYIII